MSDAAPFVGIPTSQDTARLVFAAPYFDTIPVAEMLEPAVAEAAGPIIAELLPPLLDDAVASGIQAHAVLITGSTMTGPLNLSPLMPTGDYMAATKAYVDTMISTAGVPEVPVVPLGQSWMRQTGQWVPVPGTAPGGPFLPIAGGTMAGQINMAGNAINNLSSIPNAPNGAAPRQWVLDQIAAVSLYQGTWNLDTNTPDLSATQYRVNGYTWIATTTNPSGVVIAAAVPGLQGKTVYNGDHVVYSSAQGTFTAIQNVGLTVGVADGRYVALLGSTMTGHLILSGNATQPLHPVTLQQLQAFVPTGAIPEAPTDGQIYGRGGATSSWFPVLPIAGGVLTGSLVLNGNATLALQAVPLQQLTATINTSVNNYLPLSGGSMTGLMTLSGNAGANLNPVPLQQLNAMLGGYVAKTGDTMTGALTVNLNAATPSIALGGQLQVIGANGDNPQLSLDCFGGAGNTPVLKVRHARGTAASPSAVQGNDYLFLLEADGYAATNYGATSPFVVQAIENWTGSANGTKITFTTVSQGTTTPVNSLTLAGNAATFSGTGNFAGVVTVAPTNPASWAEINLNKGASGAACLLIGQTAGLNRWDLQLGNNSAETGSNAGSDFAIDRYSDAGTFNGTTLSISRATGKAWFGYSLGIASQAVPADAQPSNLVGASDGLVASTAGATGATLASNLYMAGSGWKYHVTGAGSLVQMATTGCNWWTAPSGTGGTAATITQVAILDPSGNLTIQGATAAKPGGGAWAAISERALKEDIEPYQTGLAALTALKPCRYRYASDTGLGDETHIGLIHDETADMPELHRRLRLLSASFGDEGREVDGLDHTPLTFALINAVRELAAKVEALEKRNGRGRQS